MKSSKYNKREKQRIEAPRINNIILPNPRDVFED